MPVQIDAPTDDVTPTPVMLARRDPKDARRAKARKEQGAAPLPKQEIRKWVRGLMDAKRVVTGDLEMTEDERIDAVVAMWEPYLDLQPVPLQIEIPWWAGMIPAAVVTLAMMFGPDVGQMIGNLGGEINASAQSGVRTEKDTRPYPGQ